MHAKKTPKKASTTPTPKGGLGLVDIYELIDPRDGSVRYIGKANDAAKRIKSHMWDCRNRMTPVYAWIRKLISLGMEPQMRVVSRIAASEWEHEEKRIIFEARLTHPKILNVADGGNTPKCSIETRQRNARNLNSGAYNKLTTRTELIIYTYDKILKFWAKRGDGKRAKEMASMMMERASSHPEDFGCWKKITLMCNGQAI